MITRITFPTMKMNIGFLKKHKAQRILHQHEIRGDMMNMGPPVYPFSYLNIFLSVSDFIYIYYIAVARARDQLKSTIKRIKWICSHFIRFLHIAHIRNPNFEMVGFAAELVVFWLCCCCCCRYSRARHLIVNSVYYIHPIEREYITKIYNFGRILKHHLNKKKVYSVIFFTPFWFFISFRLVIEKETIIYGCISIGSMFFFSKSMRSIYNSENNMSQLPLVSASDDILV